MYTTKHDSNEKQCLYLIHQCRQRLCSFDEERHHVSGLQYNANQSRIYKHIMRISRLEQSLPLRLPLLVIKWLLSIDVFRLVAFLFLLMMKAMMMTLMLLHVLLIYHYGSGGVLVIIIMILFRSLEGTFYSSTNLTHFMYGYMTSNIRLKSRCLDYSFWFNRRISAFCCQVHTHTHKQTNIYTNIHTHIHIHTYTNKHT